MNIVIETKRNINDNNVVFLTENITQLPVDIINQNEIDYIKKNFKQHQQELFIFNKAGRLIVIKIFKQSENNSYEFEKSRQLGNDINILLKKYFIDNVFIDCSNNLKKHLYALAEGIILGSYSFNKYKNADFEQKQTSINTIYINEKNIESDDLETLKISCEAVYKCRDLVNEPALTLTPEAFADIVKNWAKDTDIKFECFNKKKIESLKMGGLLAVNKGSFLHPTFSVMEWKPDNAINKKPYVLVGKGVTYDTGGFSLKSSANMNGMKSDMSGAAAVAAVIFATAKAKLPLHVIALMPATDNRLGDKAIVPGDIITMMDGTTVEVLNTDAEGRLILADALSYAKKLKPLLVIDIATLTGAAMVAIGNSAIAAMQSNAEDEFNLLKISGNETHERIAELPNWDDYKDAIKSDIADIKNIGGKFAGAITAFKFLEHFVDYPFIHLDIAGPAFLETKDSYRGSGGTGSGVRLLFDFLIKKSNKIVN